MPEPPIKKMREHATPEWSIQLDDASGLRSILDAVQAITQRVFFRVAKVEESYMLMFDGADVGMTCCVSARLHLDNVVVHIPDNGLDDEFTFCVDCKQLKIALNNPSCSHGSFSIEYLSDATIHCRMQDPEQLSHEDCSQLDTYVDVKTPIELDDMKFDIKIEIDIPKLREMIKKARDTHSEHMRVKIYLRTDGSRQFSLIIFSVKGDAYHCQKFSHETSRDEDGSLRVRAVADGEINMFEEQDKTEYEAVFPVDKLEAFVKILPCRMIVATVTQGMPLMMTHTLGGGITAAKNNSSVRFLIAPINEDD